MLTTDKPTAAQLDRIVMMVMDYHQCCETRKNNDQIDEGASIGCFPDLFSEIEGAGGIDQAITL